MHQREEVGNQPGSLSGSSGNKWEEVGNEPGSISIDCLADQVQRSRRVNPNFVTMAVLADTATSAGIGTPPVSATNAALAATPEPVAKAPVEASFPTCCSACFAFLTLLDE